MNLALVNFDIDNYLNKFAEKLSSVYRISSYFGYRRPKKTSSLSNSNFVDATCLYKISNINEAFEKNLNISEKNFSKEDVNYYTNYFLIFSKILDRVTPQLNSNNYNELYFWKLIGYYSDYIEKKKIDLFLFDCTPHRPWDFILFTVAKRMNIKTLIFRRTEIPGKNLLVEDYESKKLNFNFNYKMPKDENFSSILSGPKNFEKIESILVFRDIKDGLTLKNYIASNKLKILSKKNIFYKILYFFIRLLKIIEIKFIFFDVFFKSIPVQKIGASENSVPNTTLAGVQNPNRFNYFLIKFLTLVRNKEVNNFNNNLKISNNITKNKYIFFPLPYQPERTTLPEAGNYNSVVNAIKSLSKNLPDEIFIVVKEHPKLLYKDVRSFHFRDKFFYEELLNIEKVILVKAERDFNQLINNSLMTACLCGSVTFQGLVNGKPSIVFGSTWLSDCNSVECIEENTNIKNSITKLALKNEVETKDDIRKFLLNNQVHFINAACSGWEIERFNLSLEENLDNLISFVKVRIDSEKNV